MTHPAWPGSLVIELWLRFQLLLQDAFPKASSSQLRVPSLLNERERTSWAHFHRSRHNHWGLNLEKGRQKWIGEISRTDKGSKGQRLSSKLLHGPFLARVPPGQRLRELCITAHLLDCPRLVNGWFCPKTQSFLEKILKTALKYHPQWLGTLPICSNSPSSVSLKTSLCLLKDPVRVEKHSWIGKVTDPLSPFPRWI